MSATIEARTLPARLDRCIATAADSLFAQQRPDGSWEGYLPSSAVSTAATVLALHVSGPRGSAELVEAGADWLERHQQDDGGWPDAPGGPSTLNATAIAASALKVVRPGAARQLERAVEAMERFGGRAAIEDRQQATLNTICRVFLAFAGLYPERRVPRIPVEVILLPRRLHEKVSFILPALLSWGVMHGRLRRSGPLRRSLSRRAEARTLEYLRGIWAFEGDDGGCQESALLAALIVFGLVLAGVGDDVVEHNLRFLRAAVREDGSWPVDRDLELSGTCYVAQGLQDAGLGDDPRLVPTMDWILRSQRDVALAATRCPPGGWGWSLPSSWPDTDDTSHALLTLVRHGLDHRHAAIGHGAEWLHAMRNPNGSWSCFIRNGRLMFDAPCSACTAHATMTLHAIGGRDHDLRRAVAWMAGAQHADGALSNVWFRDLTSGTARTLDALAALGLQDGAVAQRCAGWLIEHQEAGGGWGDGQGAPATVEETSWAALSLINAGHAGHPAVTFAIRWLIDRQQPDGLWPASLVSYYYNGLTYWCDAMANGYAVQTLGRYRSAQGPARRAL
jgi:squalene-hopene/tetraprenyl-beta-curcumene cyclase